MKLERDTDMFIEGHKQIIDDAIAAHKIASLTPEERKQLRKGITFPDLACKKFVASPSGEVTLSDADTCSLIKLVKTMHGKEFGFSTIYQFHRGALLLLHSMAPDTTSTLAEYRARILDVILALLVKSTQFKNAKSQAAGAFYIGILLHTITDSYPRGHTVRDSFYIPPLLKGSKLPNPKPGFTKEARKEITAAIAAIAEDTTQPLYKTEETAISAIKQRLAANTTSMRVTYYLRTKQRSIFHTYLIYKFLNQLNSTAAIYKQRLRIVPSLGIYTHKPTNTNKYDLLHFQYYEIQNTNYHKWEDLLSAVKHEPALYSRILQEVATVINLYKDFCENKLTADQYIKKAYAFIAKNTFRISAKHKNNPTAMPSDSLNL